MIEATLDAGRGARVLWVVPGLLAEGRRVARALTREAPEAVAIGVSPEELEGLLHFVREPVEDEGWWSETYARALSRFGAVGFPPPAYVEAARWALEHDVPAHGLDMPQDDYDESFTKNVSAWQWWRHGRRMRKMEKRPPRADSPEAFAAAWEDRLRRAGEGIRAVEDAREAAFVARLREVAREARLVAVVEVALQAGIAAKAGAAPSR